MRASPIAVAALAALTASSSYAALTVTAVRGTSANAPGFDVIRFFVRDDAGGSTSVQAQSFQFFVDPPNELFFGEDQDEFGGVLPGQNAAALASRNEPAGTFAFLPSATNVAVIPAGTGNFADGSTAFSAQSFRTASAFTTTASTGLLAAAAVVTPGAQVRAVISVNSTLDSVNTINLNITVPGVGGDTVVIAPSAVTVDVSPAGLESFGPVTVTGTSGSGVSQVTFGTIPAQIADNITLGGTGLARTISGAGFTFADIGTYTISATVGSATQNFTLTVVPEPTTLAVAGLAGFGLVRRRK